MELEYQYAILHVTEVPRESAPAITSPSLFLPVKKCQSLSENYRDNLKCTEIYKKVNFFSSFTVLSMTHDMPHNQL